MSQPSILILLLVLVVGAVVVALLMGGDPGGDAPKLDEPRADRTRAVAPPARPGSVTGQVRLFKTGEAVPDVVVRIVDTDGEVDVRTATGEDGSFTAMVPSGTRLTLTVDAPEPYASVVRPGIQAKPGRRVSVGTLLLERSFLVKGLVVDADGNPITDAEVRVHPPASKQKRRGMFDAVLALLDDRVPLETVRTDPEGAFVFRTLSPGAYGFEADRAGYAVGFRPDVVVSPDALDRPIRIVLTPGTRLRGTVRAADGSPVSGATLTVLRLDFEAMMRMRFSPVQTTTDENGTYAFDNLPRIEAAVLVTAPGFPIGSEQNVDLERKEVLDIVLGGTATLEGTVRDEAGGPIAGASVMAVVAPGGESVGRTETDANGSYRLEHLEAGSLQMLMVSKDGYPGWPPGGIRGMGAQSLGRLEAGKTLTKDITLTAGATVRGRVHDANTGRGIPGAEVRVLDQSTLVGFGGASAVSNHEGLYVLQGVAVGRHGLLVKAPGYVQEGLTSGNPFAAIMGGGPEDSSFTVHVEQAGADLEKNFALKPGARISGRVTTPDGRPLASARVSLAPEQDGPFAMIAGMLGLGPEPVVTNADGRFRLEGIPGGKPVRIQAEAEGWVAGTSDPVSPVEGGEVTEVVVAVRLPGAVEGVVTGPNGAPVPGASVRAVEKPKSGVDWEVQQRLMTALATATDAAGRFRVEGVPPGDVVVEASAPGLVAARVDAHVVEGGATATLELRLQTGLEIAGTVRDGDGRPLSGVQVMAWGGQAYRAIRPVQTDATGAFRIDGLPAGEYTVSLNMAGFVSVTRQNVRSGTTDLSIVLDAGLAITGRVVDPQGSAVAGVYVTATGEKANAGAMTGPDGAFRIEGVGEGTYRVVVQNLGNSRLRGASVEGVSAGQTDVLIRLRAGLEITGTVVDENGRPVAGVRVVVQGVNEGGESREAPTSTTRTDDSGAFVLRGLDEGLYRVVAFNPNLSSRVSQVVRGGSQVRLRISKEPEIGLGGGSEDEPVPVPVPVEGD